MTVSARRKDDSGKDEPELGYEQARDELIEVVRKLEAGGLSLEESLALWERGEALAATCERQLAGARDRVEAALSRAEEPPEEPPTAKPDK